MVAFNWAVPRVYMSRSLCSIILVYVCVCTHAHVRLCVLMCGVCACGDSRLLSCVFLQSFSTLVFETQSFTNLKLVNLARPTNDFSGVSLSRLSL